MQIEGLTQGALILLLLKEIIGYFSNKKRDHDNAQLKATTENTLAVTELRVEVKNLKEVIAPLPKMKEDLFIAHERIRILGEEKGLFKRKNER